MKLTLHMATKSDKIGSLIKTKMITIFVIGLYKTFNMGYQDFDDNLKKAINILIVVGILVGLVYLFIFFLKIAIVLFVIGGIISAAKYLFNGGNGGGNGPPWLNK